MNRKLITVAHEAWSRDAAARAERTRFKRYTYGDQWSDPAGVHGSGPVTEGDLIQHVGRQPPVNNLIRRLVKTIIGRYRGLSAQNNRYGDTPLNRLNNLAELDARLLEEFLISGRAIQRVAPDIRPAGQGVWVDNVSPERFFTGAFDDPRGHDLQMCGMLHDMTPAEVMARFGHGDPERCQRVLTLCHNPDTPCCVTGSDIGFFSAAHPSRYRVVELWTLDAAQNAGAKSGQSGITFGWQCRWLTTAGDLLASYASPWAHGMHPFVFSFYPYTDGEVHPFVEDVIGIQRYINRLIALVHHIMGSSAKGVLLFPVQQKVPEMSWEEVISRWSRCDGVIPITGLNEVLPQQVNAAGADNGAYRLLDLELKLMQDVSGVSESLMGNIASANTGSRVYESQIANATMALYDILETFGTLTRRRDALAGDAGADTFPLNLHPFIKTPQP